MTQRVVEVSNLEKVYPNGVKALRKLTFSVNKGEIYALIGPNGAGKTTTLRILATLIRPTSGEARVLGNNVVRYPERVRRSIGYLPEDAGAYPRLTGYEYLRFIAEAYGVRDVDAAVERGKEYTGLGYRLREKVKGYSKGMVRRLLLASILMLEPKLAILDEPTSGMDVLHSTHIRKMIREWVAESGNTVLLSSHNMLEVEFLSDRIMIIAGGKGVLEGEPEEVKRRFGARNLEEVFVEVVRVGPGSAR